MTSMADKRDQVAPLLREIKEEKVRSTHDPDRRKTNIHNVAHGWRGDELVVAIQPSGLSVESALSAARAAAIGFGCDALALTTETYQAVTSISPLTGQRWAPGEMQRAADEHNALETGSVTEALVTLVVNRAEDVTGSNQRYRIHRSVNGLGIVSYSIEWLPERADADGYGGRVPRLLVNFMNEVPVDVLVAREGITPDLFGLTAEQALTQVDCATVKALVRSGFDGAVMLLADNPGRAEIIDKSLGNLGERLT